MTRGRGLVLAFLVVASLLIAWGPGAALSGPQPPEGRSAPLAMYAGATSGLESQAWWSKTGIVIPTSVGQHVHLAATVPADGEIVDGIVSIPITVKLHAQTGATSFLRAGGWASSGEIAAVTQIPLALGPCDDCAWSGSIDVDFSKWPTGRDELRLTANIPSNADKLRQYESTGLQICVRSCTPTYRTGTHIEARGWYSGHGYANAKLASPLATVCSQCIITVRLSPGAGGLATKLAGVYIDPDFHHGTAGVVVKTWSAAFTGSVMLPALADGPHKLVLLSSDGFNAGVLVVPFAVP